MNNEPESQQTPALPFVLDGVQFQPRQLPIAPEIQLYLMQDDYPEQNLDQNNYQRLMQAPPYWAFCWGGGQALARWILDHSAVVAGRCVTDFGAGSGVAAIAALKAAAHQACAVDIDLGALQACEANAKLNGVSLTVEPQLPFPGVQDSILLAADICYEDSGFEGVLSHIEQGSDALVAESRLRNLSQTLPALQKVAEYQVRTFPDLDESENYDLVQIFATEFAQKHL